jgi:GNAT superfamily N-acetyltransferase
MDFGGPICTDEKSDMKAIREFLGRTYAATHHPFYSVDPPNWERIRIALRKGSDKRSLRLWELAEHPSTELVGMAIYEKKRSQFSCLVYPDYEEIENQIFEWAEEKHNKAKTERGEAVPLKCSVCETNDTQIAVLARRGYIKGKLDTVFRRRSLDGISSKTIAPVGYNIQDGRSSPGKSLPERALVESKVFGTTISIEFLRELRGSPTYRPELDLVVTSADGRISAFCTLWFDDINKVGFVEPIGTVPAYRRQGLAKALLLEGFQRLKRLGAETAYLGHGSDNAAGNQLYESVRMPVFDQEYLWQKEL